MRFKTHQKILQFLLLILAHSSLLYSQTDEAHRGLSWLRSQMQFDIDPGPDVAKLVKSYESSSIIGAWTYDQALAIIAFAAAGDDSSARRVLDALRLKQAANGSWDFAYAYNTGAQLDTRIPVGTNAWAVIAIAQYERITGDDSYRDMALKCANWLLRFRNGNRNQETYGAFVMGPDHHSTTWDESTVNGVTGIQGFDANASFDLPVDKVWSEGSEGMVTAYFSTGNPVDSVRAVLFHAQTKRYQSANGGVPYATENPDGWVSFNSVAGTAWFVFNELRINPFRAMKKIGTSIKDDENDTASGYPDGFRLDDIYPNPSHSNTDEIVARIDESEITKKEIASRAEFFPPPKFASVNGKTGNAALLELLIGEKLMAQAARQANLDTTGWYREQIAYIKLKATVEAFIDEEVKSKIEITP